ncbi:MAG: LPS assembly protein LptD, partial [Terriglobia bacterium]
MRVPRPDAPAKGAYFFQADDQESDNGVYHLRGSVVVELHTATFKADEADYDENTKIFKARGHVYYRDYEQNEIIYSDSVEYNTDTQTGTFENPRGYSKTKVVARPGVLTTQQPFYFEGKSAEKLESKYVLHDGFITDCALPKPWWTLHGATFDIVPGESAVTRHAVYHLRNFPVFYFPYFYKSLKKEPRKSGFLTPNIVHSSTRGYGVAVGYYWAFSRSMDVTYVLQDFSVRGLAHHVDFRGKPTQKADFNLIFDGAQDKGYKTDGGTLIKTPGYSITGGARTEFADGWTARASANYISSLAYRQQFSQSFNEAIFSETHAVGSVEKNFGYYNFTTAASRSEEFVSDLKNDSVVIRKLPEFDFTGRDRRLASTLPVWFSFETSAGLYNRKEPRPEQGFYETSQFSSRADFEPTLTAALHWRRFSLVPSFTLHETFYSQRLLNGAVANNSLTRTAPEANVDFIMPSIERIFNKKTFMGEKLKHVIEPRASYKYVSGVKSFSDTLRFDPIDLLSDTSEVEIGVTNRLYAKKGDTVNEVLTWEVFQKRFFDPTFGNALLPGQRNVLLSSIDLTGYSFFDGPRNYSPIVSIVRGSPRPGVNITWEADYDPLRKRVTNSMFSADFRINRYFFSAGSDQIRPDVVVTPPANQFRSTFGYGDPNRKGLNGAFSMVYDYKLARVDFGVGQV